MIQTRDVDHSPLARLLTPIEFRALIRRIAKGKHPVLHSLNHRIGSFPDRLIHANRFVHDNEHRTTMMALSAGIITRREPVGEMLR
jgi:hypothetical protein